MHLHRISTAYPRISRNISKYLPGILLMILLLGLAPVPARAAPSVNFDVKENGISVRSVAAGSHTFQLETAVSGVDSNICSGFFAFQYSAIDFSPQVVVARSTGSTFPDVPTGRGVAWHSLDEDVPSVQFSDPITENFAANPPGTVVNYRAYVLCIRIQPLTGTFIEPNVLTASGEIRVSTTGMQVPAFPAGAGQDSSFASFLSGTIVSVVNVILGILASIFRWIVWTLGYFVFLPLLETTMSIHAADVTDFVLQFWQVIRDLVNMLFILVLIIIGFGTMLRLESYSYKKLLVNLIVMAMLVNFSLVIGRIIINLSDLLQFTFLPIGDEGMNKVKTMFQTLSTRHVVQILDSLILNIKITAAGALSQTFTIIFQLIFDLSLVLTIGALAAFMLIRTVVLWILLIFSPFAYALAILPTTASYAKKWWETFIKYVLFAPIIAFFLRVSFELYENALKIFPPGSIFDPQAGVTTSFSDWLGTRLGVGVTLKDTFVLVMTYTVILVFLWAGLIITRQMGIFGANAIVGLAERGLKAPFAGGKWLGKQIGTAAWRYGATKYDEKTLGLATSKSPWKRAAYAALHPFKFRQAMKSDAEKDRERAKGLAAAAALKVKRETPLLRREGKDPMFHALMEQGEEELNERFGKYSGNESEEVKRSTRLETAARSGDKKAARMLIAQTLRNAKGKHINQDLYEKGLAYNHANLTAHFNDLEKAGVFSESVNEELQTQLSEIGYAIGDSVLTELSDGGRPLEVEETKNSGKSTETYYNPQTGKTETRALKEYQYKGVEKLLEAEEEARHDPTVTAANREVKVETLARAKGLSDQDLQNARRALTNVRNRNINVSKVDKFNLFHNAHFTTQLDSAGNRQVVLGDGGDQAFLNIEGGDIWRASRNGIPDKSKEWINNMIKETGDAKASVNAMRVMLGNQYNQWLAARGEFRDQATFNKELEEKVENFAKMIYASKFNKPLDAIERDAGTGGRTTHADRAEFLVEHFRTGERV